MRSFPAPAFLQRPSVAVRVGELGEAGVVGAARFEARLPGAAPVVERSLVAEVADLDAPAQELVSCGLEVLDDQKETAEGSGSGVGEPYAELHGAARAGRCEL